jgi:hypothetical protein
MSVSNPFPPFTVPPSQASAKTIISVSTTLTIWCPDKLREESLAFTTKSTWSHVANISTYIHMVGLAIAQTVSRRLPTAAVRGSSPGLVMWDFVVDKVALGQVFSEYFGFPCQSSFHQLLQKSSSPVIWGLYNRPQYQGLSPTAPIINK